MRNNSPKKEDAVIFLEKLNEWNTDNPMGRTHLSEFLSCLPREEPVLIGTRFEVCDCGRWNVVNKYCLLQKWIGIRDGIIWITSSGKTKLKRNSNNSLIKIADINKLPRNAQENTGDNSILQKGMIFEDDREGQDEFRRILINQYGKCLLSGNEIKNILEAAHVERHNEGGIMHISNGILLTRNFHKLFDDKYILLKYDESIRKIKIYVHPDIQNDNIISEIDKFEIDFPDSLKKEYLIERFEKDKRDEKWKGLL